jgi:hypothetical protein
VISVEAILKARPIILLMTVALLIFPSAVSAQGPTGTQEATQPAPCAIDLSDATALMTRAQSKGSAGDVSEALALIDQVKQKLDEIQAQCSSANTALTGNFTERSGAFSVSYPKGWITQPLADTPAEQAKGPGPILFASSPEMFNMIADGKVGVKERGVVVYVGASGTLMEQLGTRGVSKAVNPLNPLNLLDRIVQGQTSGDVKFGTPTQGAAIKDYGTAEATFALSNGNGVAVADGGILLMQLGTDQFAVFVSFAPPGEGKSIADLGRAMAATLKAPAQIAQ